MTDAKELTCVWDASIDALESAVAELSFSFLEVTAGLLHVQIPRTARSGEGMGSLLANHLFTSIARERELAGGILSADAKIRLEGHYGEFILRLSKALRAEANIKKMRSQVKKEKRFYAKAEKIRTARNLDSDAAHVTERQLAYLCLILVPAAHEAALASNYIRLMFM
ncbi:hypothetical protein FS837_000769 [Tulasnella sp. UAMH 9824]|nr:hypothetical protein FS837_000769 [Tulasnella sp. UAMH 9824]